MDGHTSPSDAVKAKINNFSKLVATPDIVDQLTGSGSRPLPFV